MKNVLGVFNSNEDAELAIHDLMSHGYSPKDISIVMQDRRSAEELLNDTVTFVAGNTAAGAISGILIGDTGDLASILLFPGIGPFLVRGPIASVLGITGISSEDASVDATGADAGGLIEALTGFGLFSSEEAKTYETRVKEGAILLVVPSRIGQSIEVEEILDRYDATDIKTFVLGDVTESGKQHTQRTHHSP